MEYYTYDTETKMLKLAPSVISMANGIHVANPDADTYASINAYPRSISVPPTPPSGKIAIVSGYVLQDNHWVPQYTYVDTPPSHINDDALANEPSIGESMTQKEMSVAMVKIWRKLGGTVAIVATAIMPCLADTEWWDVPPTQTVVEVVGAAGFADCEYVDEKEFVVDLSTKVYRTGQSGQVGSGYAYYAVDGSGHRRYAARMPRIEGWLKFRPSATNDPFCAMVGTSVWISASAPCAVEGLYSYTTTGYEGYMGVTAGYRPVRHPTRDIESGFYLQLSKNALGGSATPTVQVSEFTDDNGTFWWNLNVANGTNVSYTTLFYDSASDQYVSSNFSFTVAFDDRGGDKIVMRSFGDAGTLMTSADIDKARSQTVMRTGKRGELGTGPGVKVYDFTSDVRTWQLNVPKLTATSSKDLGITAHPNYSGYAGRVQATNVFANYSADKCPDISSSICFFGLFYKDPLSYAGQYALVTRRVTHTEGSYNSTTCLSADSEVMAFPMDTNRVEYGEGVFNFTASNCLGTATGWGTAYLVTNGLTKLYTTPTSGNALVRNGYEVRMTTVTQSTWLDGQASGYSFSNDPGPVTNEWTLFNFRIDTDQYGRFSFATNGSSLTCTARYDFEASGGCWYATSGSSPCTIARSNPQLTYRGTVARTLTLQAFPTTSESVESTGVRLITDANQHLFWDDALKATWEMSVSNGCAVIEVIGGKDYRKEDY